jgi:hypothetical protein
VQETISGHGGPSAERRQSQLDILPVLFEVPLYETIGKQWTGRSKVCELTGTSVSPPLTNR